jgi:hypothetical protein
MLHFDSVGGAVLCDCRLAGAGVCRHQHTLPALDAAHRLLLERVQFESVSEGARGFMCEGVRGGGGEGNVLASSRSVSPAVTVEKGSEVNTRNKYLYYGGRLGVGHVRSGAFAQVRASETRRQSDFVDAVLNL